ncbi:hypothetical protein JYB87_09305 [Shewanella avicenniae]|uniref:PH domain-containing protein n=1 Tax=Shewanella avicenniae TaxID=2814294 RepID=A0ABX7QLY6_9GAMM|nr:hypothetical protein [Shewanella avicenniae]QSX31991.1 hypothetical protein JYB87_09305 [Shewanella avicenniae]
MASRGSLGKAGELIMSDEGCIKYDRHFPLWLRIFLFPWAFLCIPFVFLYVDSASSVNWVEPPVFKVIFATFGFLILPICFSGLILWFVLFGASVSLTLDSKSRVATLQRKSLFRNKIARYPLADLKIFKVELEADYPTYDAAIVTLRMPDGLKVTIGCFFRDEEAKFWVEQIRNCIDAKP